MNRGGYSPDCVIVPTFEGATAALGGRFDATPLAWLGASGALADHAGKKNEITVCYASSAEGTPRVILLGLGPDGALDLDAFRLAVGAAVRRCKKLRLARPALLLEDLDAVGAVLKKNIADVLRETVVASLLAVYACTAYKSAESRAKGETDGEGDFFTPDSLTFMHSAKTIPASLRLAAQQAEAEASGVCRARDLVNAPANIMTPARLAEEALSLAKRHGFGCRVLRKAEMTKLGMGALLAVSEGARNEARFIILEYTPEKGKNRAPLVLVGKGITFDSGGISLKPAAGMHLMKGDMAGAAAVLGAFEAIGRFGGRIACPVVGLLPCTENMPDGGAVRPGDIVTTMSGKTVEITNTDAEGRLILCDALAYAQKKWKPAALVDIATLTGACAVALGRNAAGLFTDCIPLRDAILAVGDEVGDTCWPMPLWERLREGLQSDVADMGNVGAREGGAITAALFLKAFVDGDIPWAHLDMAGASINEKNTPLCPKGATGFGVRTLFGLVRRVSEKSGAW